jgi:hypothetical protein
MILVGSLLAPELLRAGDAEEQETAQEIGAVLAWRLGPESLEEWCQSKDPEGSEARQKALKAWLDKNAALIQQVDTRVAEVVPRLYPPSKKGDAVQAVRAQVKAMLVESISAENTADEATNMCKAETDPASPTWNNPGMPNVQLSLAALYDWTIKHGEK